MKKSELLARVRELVADVTRARFEGSAYAKLMRAHGYADGYMAALLDAGLVDRGSLLEAVGSARRAVVEAELEPTSSVRLATARATDSQETVAPRLAAGSRSI